MSLHGPRHSPYSTILPLDVRPDDSFYISKAGFLLGKMLGKDECFFWTKPWVFQKKHDWESRFSSMMVFLCLICLAGKPAIVSGISKHLNSFYEYFHRCTLFFRQVLTICNLSCFNSHFSNFSAAFQLFPLLESMCVGDPNF